MKFSSHSHSSPLASLHTQSYHHTEVYDVELKKDASGLGITIAGAEQHGLQGIVVTSITPRGPADCSGKMKTGDQILTVSTAHAHCTPPHYTPLHHTTLHLTTPHHTTPNYTPPHYPSLHYTTPHHTTPHHTTLHYTTPHYITPHHTTPHHTTLPHTKLPHTTLPHTTLPHTTPHYTTLHHTMHVSPVFLCRLMDVLSLAWRTRQLLPSFATRVKGSS